MQNYAKTLGASVLAMMGCSTTPPPTHAQDERTEVSGHSPKVTEPEKPQTAAEPAENASAGRDALREAWKKLGSGADGKTNRSPSPEALNVIVPLLTAVHDECAAGNGISCWLYHHDYEQFLKFGRKQRETVQPLLARLCKPEDQVACALAADVLDDPSGRGGDASTALTGLKAACDAGLTDACGRAALLRLTSGLGGDVLTEEQAKTMRASACERGFLSACRVVGTLMGAYSGDFDRSPNYTVAVRGCSLGNLEDCEYLLRNLVPSVFGCDQCAPNSMNQRCVECEVQKCIEEHCCETCEHRNSAACCVESMGKMPTHPRHAPLIEKSRAAQLLEAGKAGMDPARALFVQGCAQGHEPMCLADMVDRGLASFSTKLDEVTASR